MRKLRTVLVVLALAVAARAGAAVISIDAARHKPLGTVVTVEGAVTAPSGAFGRPPSTRVSGSRTGRPGSM